MVASDACATTHKKVEALMDIVFVTAALWFLVGFLFHAGLVWYDERQKKKAFHEGLDGFLRGLGDLSRRDIDVVVPPLQMVDYRKEEAWKN